MSAVLRFEDAALAPAGDGDGEGDGEDAGDSFIFFTPEDAGFMSFDELEEVSA